MVPTITIGVIYYIFNCYLYGCKSGPLIYREIHSWWCFRIYQSVFLPYEKFCIYLYAGGETRELNKLQNEDVQM